MKGYKLQGIIIKRQNFGEADKILTVFTRENGKIKIVAKGIRRISSRRSPHVELLNLSTLFIYKGKALPILTEAQVIHDFLEIKKDLGKIGFSYNLCELVDSLCPEEERNERVFNLLKDALFNLSVSDNKERIIKDFEQNILQILGFTSYGDSFSGRQLFVEDIIERKLKSKKLLSHFD